MRTARIVGALVALVMVAVIGQTLVSPAHAAGKPEHSIKASGGEIGHSNKFFIKGKIKTFPSGKIKLLRNVAGGPYKAIKKVKVKHGKFQTPIAEVGRAKTCFKLQVPGTAQYKKTTTPVIGCITTTR